MLIQAYYQQERERYSATRATENPASRSNSSNGGGEASAAATANQPGNSQASGTANDAAPAADDASTDVEMTDASAAGPPTIKTEPLEESSMSESADPIATAAEDSADKMDVDDEKSEVHENEIKAEVEENEGNASASDSNNSEQPSGASSGDGATSVDGQAIKVEEPSTSEDADDPYAKDIDIDPRTYCKLGHFHLLLEDYPRGEFCRHLECAEKWVSFVGNFAGFSEVCWLLLDCDGIERDFCCC